MLSVIEARVMLSDGCAFLLFRRTPGGRVPGRSPQQRRRVDHPSGICHSGRPLRRHRAALEPARATPYTRASLGNPRYERGGPARCVWPSRCCHLLGPLPLCIYSSIDIDRWIDRYIDRPGIVAMNGEAPSGACDPPGPCHL